MTYALIETSTEDGRPIELYEFTRSSSSWYYTSADVDIDYNGNTYISTAINRSSIEQDQDFDKNTVSIELNIDNELGLSFLPYTPDNPTIVNIYREHFEDGEFIIYWKGRVTSPSSTGSTITLECGSIANILQTASNRSRIMKPCRHILYSTQCGVDKADFRVPVIIENVSGTSFDYVALTEESSSTVDAFFAFESIASDVISDVTGNGYDANETDVTIVSGWVNNAASFNGSSSYVQTPYVLPTLTSWSVSFAVLPSAVSGVLISNGLLEVGIDASGYFYIDIDGDLATGGVLYDGVEYQLITVSHDIDTDDYVLKVGSTVAATLNTTNSIGTGSVYIGSTSSLTDYYSGIIDQLRFWNIIVDDYTVAYLSSEPDNDTLTSDYFLVGMAEDINGAYRFINSQVDTTLNISYPFESLSDGDILYLYAGCNHRPTTDCLNKFDNLLNYGGFPYFPNDDGPFSGRSIS